MMGVLLMYSAVLNVYVLSDMVMAVSHDVEAITFPPVISATILVP